MTTSPPTDASSSACGTGKTYLLCRLLERLDIFESEIKQVYILFSVNQSTYAEVCDALNARGVKCTLINYNAIAYGDLPGNFDVTNLRETERALVVADDVSKQPDDVELMASTEGRHSGSVVCRVKKSNRNEPIDKMRMTGGARGGTRRRWPIRRQALR